MGTQIQSEKFIINKLKVLTTKKLFLVILAGGLLFTAFKKEEKEMPTSSQSKSWKTSDWVMTKSSIIVEGTLCDEYINQITGQVVYEGMDESKAITYDKTPYYTDNFGHLDCKAPGHTCNKAVIDGDHVLIIKVGASTLN